MAQMMSGEHEFTVVPQVVLQPWMTFVAQMTIDSELHALGHAVEAVGCEVSASAHYEQAITWLSLGHERAFAYALDWWEFACKDIGQASWHWGKAAEWLKEFGDQRKGPQYASLYQHVLMQQRLSSQVEHLQLRIGMFCQEWGYSLSDGAPAS